MSCSDAYTWHPATAPAGTVSELRFTLEANANQANIGQKIALYNYVTNSYEELDSRTATTSDSVVAVIVTSNPARFIEPNTRAMNTKVSYKATGPVLSYPWLARIDQAIWRISP